MSTLRNSVPASLRKPVERYGFGERTVFLSGLIGRSPASMLTVGTEARAAALAKSRFARLPQEPEDARMTGVTRSLNRRRLGLNVPGSLRMSVPAIAVSKIA